MRAAAGEDRPGQSLRIVALGIATLFVLCACAAVGLAFSHASVADFLSFWAAGRLASGGHAALAYDIAQHRAVELQAAGAALGFLPFPYPPPFLAVLAPFGLLPFWVAFGGWIAITAALYIAATRRLLPTRFALAQGAAAANFIVGQNGFLTSAIFIRGTTLLPRRPLLGGAILGLLAVKLQLAILLPVALLAGRAWRAIAGGILSVLCVAAASLVLFGFEPWRGFLAILPHFSQWLSAGKWPWGELASVYAMLRFFEVPAAAALWVHGIVALAAAALTARAWAFDLEPKVPILAAATLLVPPYLFTYDALLLTLPMAWLLQQRKRRASFTAVWLLSLLPVVSYVTPFVNTIPLAAIAALWALHRPARDDARDLPAVGEAERTDPLVGAAALGHDR